MTVYTSLELTGRPYPTSGVGMGGRTTHRMRGQFTVTAALAAGDIVNLFNIPRNSRITGGFVKTSGQLDSNGTPTVTVSVGTAAAPGLFFNALADVGRSTGDQADNGMNPTGRDALLTVKTLVQLSLGTASATPATGCIIVVHIEYTNEEPL